MTPTTDNLFRYWSIWRVLCVISEPTDADVVPSCHAAPIQQTCSRLEGKGASK